MMYPFMTLNDDTEITHSEMKPDGRVKVYIETPDDLGGFHNATCWLPDYKWEDIKGYSYIEMNYFNEFIHSVAHLIIELSQEGGFDYASNISFKGDDSMPELSRFYGIIITMYFNDTQQHHKPHIHAFYGDYEAVIGIDGELLAGSIPSKQFRMVSGWMAVHEIELYEAWNNAVQSKHFEKIKPL